MADPSSVSFIGLALAGGLEDLPIDFLAQAKPFGSERVEERAHSGDEATLFRSEEDTGRSHDGEAQVLRKVPCGEVIEDDPIGLRFPGPS